MSESDFARASGYPTTDQTADQQGSSQQGSSLQTKVSDLADHANETVHDVTEQAKERVGDVTEQAKRTVRTLLDETRTEVTDQATSQQQRLASSLRAMGSELTQMSGAADDPGYATDLVQQAAGVTDRLAEWFENREPGDVMHEVKDFAQRRPGAFLAIAAGAGLLTGRLLRGVKDAGESSTGTTTATPTPVRTPVVPTTPQVPATPGVSTSGTYGTPEPDPFGYAPPSAGTTTGGGTGYVPGP